MLQPSDVYGIVAFMSKTPLHNALVINSNLGTPIRKTFTLSRWGERVYTPKPAAEVDEVPHLIVPEEELNDPFYSVYGFVIPDPIRLRLVKGSSNPDRLTANQQSLAENLINLGHGVTVEITDDPEVGLEIIDGPLGRNRIEWSLNGVATMALEAEPFEIVASGIRAHSIHQGFESPGYALLDQQYQ